MVKNKGYTFFHAVLWFSIKVMWTRTNLETNGYACGFGALLMISWRVYYKDPTNDFVVLTGNIVAR